MALDDATYENGCLYYVPTSHKAKRFVKGQTIEGTIVAIGPEVAFIDVGGKGEATIEVADTIYGVTMTDAAVSRVLSLRLADLPAEVSV